MHIKLSRSKEPPVYRKFCDSLVSSDRGDVPGWVLITLMTAGLVIAIWAIAGPALGNVFNHAIDRVISF